MSNTEFFARNGLQVAPGTRLRVAVGNTAQRPAIPLGGDMRYNTDITTYEAYYPANTTWASIAGTFTLPTDALFNSVTAGNSTVNSVINSSSFRLAGMVVNGGGFWVNSSYVFGGGVILLGANFVINSTGFGIGNSSVSFIANSTQLTLGTTCTLTPTTLSIGNGTVAALMNSTIFTGKSFQANNSTFLGGIAAAQYAFANQVTSSSPGGANNCVQYANSGLFAGSLGLQYNYNSNTLFVGNTIVIAGATINATSYTGTAANATFLNSSAASYYLDFANFTGQLSTAQMSPGLGYVCSTLNAGTYLYSAGHIYAVGDVFSAYSDIRLKHQIRPILCAGDILDQINGVTYYQNELGYALSGLKREKRQVGLIAQEVQRVVPEAIGIASFDIDENGLSKSGEDYLTIDYTKLIPVMIEAIKELRAEVKALKRDR